jgi:hypothetical protein
VRSYGTSTFNYFVATAAVEFDDHVSWCGMRDRVRNMVRRRDHGGAEIVWRGWLRVYAGAEIVRFAVTKSLLRRGCRYIGSDCVSGGSDKMGQ